VLPLFDSQPPLNLAETALNALADGAVVVTANARAARALALKYAEQQRTNGHAMWASPAILDWDSWLNHLWQTAAFADVDAPLALTRLQEHLLWLRVQQNEARLVVSPDELASLAQSAYALLSENELHEARTVTWLEADAEHFRQWAKAFDQLCQTRKWTSRSKIESLLIQTIRNSSLSVPKQILLVGFDRFTPAQQSLVKILRESGVRVEEAATEPQPSTHSLLAAADSHDELLACAEWCRYRLKQNPAIRIGVIAPDAGNIRAEADRTFRAVLMPQSLDLANEAGSMPFEFSLGVQLSTVPVIRAALLLLRWISKPLPEADVSWLLLSGFFHKNDSEILNLAQLDFRRRDSGSLSPEIDLKTLVDRNASALFSRQMKKVLRAAEENRALSNSNSYAYWTELAERLLRLAEWPGFRMPDSVQFQAQQRWIRLLDEVALLDFAGNKITFEHFLQTLEKHATDTIFTAESRHAPIQIMGAFESSGQTFDAIWFLGVDDAHWPQAGRPHSLLPLALQRRANMPHCDAAADTELALTATRRIAGSAQECIFSHAAQNKEGELRPSPILASILPEGIHSVSTAEFRRQIGVSEHIALKPQTESAISQSQIVPWQIECVAGGADVLRDQAACPFRAFGLRRLAARPLERTDRGLDPAQRGSLLHSILESVWSPETPEPFRIVSLEDLKAIISAQRLDEALRYHVENAFRDLVSQNANDAWMQAYLESEQQRLLTRLREWMQYEEKRQPFIVEKREERLTDVNVGDLKLNLRADRIDKLPDDSRLLLDYKTGEVSPSAWKGERPDEPQLPLYATYGNVENVSGLLFAQIRAGKMLFSGRAAKPLQMVMADLPPTSALVNQPFDRSMYDTWQQALLQLAEEFLRGEASVDPKHGDDTCKYCPLPGLCRVAEADIASEAENGETDYA
jgi:probable DNA repair protein